MQICRSPRPKLPYCIAVSGTRRRLGRHFEGCTTESSKQDLTTSTIHLSTCETSRVTQRCGQVHQHETRVVKRLASRITSRQAAAARCGNHVRRSCLTKTTTVITPHVLGSGTHFVTNTHHIFVLQSPTIRWRELQQARFRAHRNSRHPDLSTDWYAAITAPASRRLKYTRSSQSGSRQPATDERNLEASALFPRQFCLNTQISNTPHFVVFQS